MNKEELIKEVSKSSKYNQKQVGEILNSTILAIMESVSAGHKITLVNFGVFEPKKRAARKTRNPMTGESIQVPEKTIPYFSPGKNFKMLVNK